MHNTVACYVKVICLAPLLNRISFVSSSLNIEDKQGDVLQNLHDFSYLYILMDGKFIKYNIN